MIVFLAFVAVAAIGYAVYKHYGLAAIKAEVAKIEAEILASAVVVSAGSVLERLKAKL